MSSESHGANAAELSVRTADGKTQQIPLINECYDIGRANTNDVFFSDVAGLSRKHLSIQRFGMEWAVRDLGSTYGTLVNGTRITGPQVLRPNDRITAGELTLTFTQARSRLSRTVAFVEKPVATTETTVEASNLDGLLREESESSGSGHTRALIRAGRELAGHMPLDKLFDLILSLSVDAVGASRGVLMTVEDGQLQVRASKGEGIRISSHVRDVVIQERRSLLVRDALSDDALGARASIVQDQIRSMLAIPLQTDDRVIGLLYLDSPFLVREFTKRDLSLLTVMGNIAAVRIEHAKLAELEQNEKLRRQEMKHAAMIQRAILPGNFPPFPDRNEFQLHAAMTPAQGIGGDLFDFFLLDEHRLAFAIGDVSGKGVPAALFMAVARTLLRGTAQHHVSPGECMEYLNISLFEQNVSGMFVTMFYGVLDTRTGEIQFSNAGHVYPYLFSMEGGLRELNQKCGPMLGLFPKTKYGQATVQLALGEGILIYTDGVTEARNPTGQFFDEDRLKGYLANRAGCPVQQIVDELLVYVQDFAAGAPQADDITALALRYLG